MRGSPAHGVTLCEKHAEQVARNGDRPDGECAPRASWPGGSGQTVTCDVVLWPERVENYLETVRRRAEAQYKRGSNGTS